MMRVIHVMVIGSLILAASAVYKIKFDSTLQAEHVAKMRGEIRRERDAIAILRAEWARLETPQRIGELAGRHLALEPVKPTQFGTFDDLPMRPPPLPSAGDPIAGLMAEPMTTGSVTTGSAPASPRR